MTLNKKLITGFLLVAGIGLGIGLVGLYGLRQSSKALVEVRSEVYDRGQFLVKATDLARSAQVNFKIQVQEWKNTLLRGNDPAQFEKYWTSFGQRSEIVQQNLQDLLVLLDKYNVPTETVKSTMATHSGLYDSYAEAISQYDSANMDSHRVVDKLVKGVDRAPTKEIDAIVDMVLAFEAEAAVELEAEQLATTKRLGMITSVVMISGVLVAIGLGVWIGNSLSRQLRAIAESLTSGSEVVDSASREVSSYGQSLADSTNREAASIQEASASLEVLADNTRKNANSANSATEIANQTRRAVGEGKAHMDEMEAAMGAIRESSDGISQILKSIDEIAFQTNILALNAAVEAARAGEAGSGFAVVADEVRNLAQRSAQAAQETSNRIEDSIAKSHRGVEISGRVSKSLDEILEKASELDELVAGIANSVAQNSEGVDQVNSAIREIENAYQANAAITEESAASAQELSEQAVSLNRSIQDLSELIGGVRSDARKSRSVGTLQAAAKSRIPQDSFKTPSRKEEDSVLWN